MRGACESRAWCRVTTQSGPVAQRAVREISRCCSHLARRPGYPCVPASRQTRMRNCTYPVRGWNDANGSVRGHRRRRFGRGHRVGDGKAPLPGSEGSTSYYSAQARKSGGSRTHRVPKALQKLLAELIVGAYGGLDRRFSRHGTPADTPEASKGCDPSRAVALCLFYGRSEDRSGNLATLNGCCVGSLI